MYVIISIIRVENYAKNNCLKWNLTVRAIKK